MKLLMVSLFFAMCVFAQETLSVVTRNAPTTYYIGADDIAEGFEYDLITAFAKEYNYKIKWIIKDSVDEVLTALDENRADIAASGLTKTSKRLEKYIASSSYYSIEEQVVCAQDIKPRNLKALSQYEVEIIKNSSYIETLTALQKKYPKLQFKTASALTTEDIFQNIEENKSACTIADSHLVSINIRYFPSLNRLFSVSKNKHLVWYLSKNVKSKKLNTQINKWFTAFKKKQAYFQIVDKYFAHVKVFNYYDVIVYHKRIEQRLPKYINNFKSSAKTYGIPWKLLAAQSYQESHWEPKAKSPTGVRGMMMITLPTAKMLGVTNRLNYAQSIHGGAKYMQYLIDIIPKEVVGTTDRYKFALAAYNVGLGHLYDAIALGKKSKINPYVWVNMKNLLPLLSKPQYYKQTKYGYARGYEPVKYVSRINNYYEILNNELAD